MEEITGFTGLTGICLLRIDSIRMRKTEVTYEKVDSSRHINSCIDRMFPV